MSDDPAELFRAAVEENVRNMSDNEFQMLIAKTRPPNYNQFTDPADRMRATTAAIAAKQSRRPAVDHNGHPVRENTPPDPAALAALDAAIQAAQESGNWTQSIALKRQKQQLKGTPR